MPVRLENWNKSISQISLRLILRRLNGHYDFISFPNYGCFSQLCFSTKNPLLPTYTLFSKGRLHLSRFLIGLIGSKRTFLRQAALDEIHVNFASFFFFIHHFAAFKYLMLSDLYHPLHFFSLPVSLKHDFL